MAHVRILAIDQGTSSTKAVVVEPDGSVAALCERPVSVVARDGGVEVDPAELLASVIGAGTDAVARGGPVDAVALANQGETVLAWDPDTGRPLTPAMVWQDSRPQVICDELADQAPEIARRTGLVLDPYFVAPKLAWIRRHWTREGAVTTTDAWLVHRLCGAFVTDTSTASRSLLTALDDITYDPWLLEAFGLAAERLPRIAACDEAVGTTSAFGADVPLAGLMVDQQAALLAEGCLRPGDAKCTYGTGAFLLANAGGPIRSRHGLTTSAAWRLRGETAWCVDGQVFTAAAALDWLVRLGLLDAPAGVDAAAARGRDPGVVFVPGLAGLGAPHWRSEARGSWSGLSLASSRDDLVRAVIEGIAAAVADLASVAAADLGTPLPALRVDGGLARSAALLQAQADLLQSPIEVYPSPHATALGAAAACRLALSPGLTPAEAVAGWSPSAVYEPRMPSDEAAARMERWRAAAAESARAGS